MRIGMAITILLALAGCAAGDKAQWQRVGGAPADEAQLREDQHGCMSLVGVPSPGSQDPMGATRNQMIDCMRTKGWVKH